MRRFTWLLALCTGIILFSCTKIEYDNPLDSMGANYVGDDGAGDDDGDGIPNYRDRDLDSVPPVITLLGGDSIAVPVGDPQSVLTTLGARAVDALDGDISASVQQQSTITLFEPGDYTITYTVSDGAGNTATATRKVTVYRIDIRDTIAPVVTLRGDDTIRIVAGDLYLEPGATALDNMDGDLTASVRRSGAFDSTSPGTYTLTYSAADKAGNSSSVKRTVVVREGQSTDFAAPVIALKGEALVILAQGQAWTDPGATAYDSIDGDLTASIKVTGTVNSNVPGTYTITYSASDKAGNVANKTRTVKVAGSTPDDTVKPVITLKGLPQITLAVGSAFTDPGATAVDESDGDLTSSITTTGTVATDKAGTYTIVYSVSDLAGNKASVTRTVTVQATTGNDTVKPVIVLKGPNPLSLASGATFTDPGATAADDADGDVTSRITTSGTVDPSKAGDYTITYSVSDLAGNKATATRTVKVAGGTGDGSLLQKYGVPSSEPFNSINAQYTSVTVEGTGGPEVANISKFDMNWDLANKGLYTMAFNTSDGKPDWYVPLQGKVTQTFASAQPGFTLTGSGVANLDGAYYIAVSGNDLVWVKTDGSFALVFKP